MSLISQVRIRAADPERATDAPFGPPSTSRLSPPATPEGLAAAERDLGFRLPRFLARLYLEVGNGGFGPGYGFVGFAGGTPDVDSSAADLVSLYKSFSEADEADPFWAWPAKLLPVANLGCAMYCCVDCGSSEGPVVWFEPNPHVEGSPWDDSFIPLAESTEAWLQAWLRGEDLLEQAWNAKFGGRAG